jgi:hypothetical protein
LSLGSFLTSRLKHDVVRPPGLFEPRLKWSLVETAMFRYKTIGRRLQARTLSNQKTEAKIGCSALNRIAGLGMPASARVR